MKKDEQLRAKCSDELKAVIDYRSSDGVKHVTNLLAALLETYQHELVSIEPEKLERKQGAAMQVRALYDCIVNPDRNKTARV